MSENNITEKNTDIEIVDLGSLTDDKGKKSKASKLKAPDLPGEKSAKSKVLRVLDFVIPIVTVIIIACCCVYIFTVKKEYRAAQNEYDELAQIAADDVTEDVVEAEPVESEPSKPTETFRNLHIDFDKLSKINPEVVGWVFIPTLDKVNYPVVQTKDNEYYTKHTFEDEQNGSGAIFMDSMSNAALNDYNTFIYGHNMKNNTMFGQLKRFLKEDGLFEIDPYIFYYTKRHAYKFKIFAYYTTVNGSKVYSNPYDEEQYENYIEYIQTLNQYENGINTDFSSHPKIITLSTCTGAHTKQRTIIQGILVDDYEIAK